MIVHSMKIGKLNARKSTLFTRAAPPGYCTCMRYRVRAERPSQRSDTGTDSRYTGSGTGTVPRSRFSTGTVCVHARGARAWGKALLIELYTEYVAGAGEHDVVRCLGVPIDAVRPASRGWIPLATAAPSPPPPPSCLERPPVVAQGGSPSRASRHVEEPL